MRKIQLAEDLVEVSLKRLQARRIPTTKKYKHNLIEERKILQTSISSVIQCVQRQHVLLAHDLNEILQILLIKITDKEQSVDIDEQTKSQFMQLLWHTCIPLHSVQS